MRKSLVLCCLLVALPAAAQVNKCVVDGKVVYQAAPCKTGTQKAVIMPRHDIAEDDAKMAREKFLEADGARKQRDKKASVDDQIAWNERQIAEYQKAMDAELAALKASKTQAANNLAGATYEQSISTEMQAVTAKYQTKIQAAQEKIKSLRKERESLGG